MTATKSLLILAFSALLLMADEPPPFRLDAAPQHLLEDSAAFTSFATEVREQIEALLAHPPHLDDPATLQRLLALRVHLAHHFTDNERAASTAAWIRTLQTDPAERAFAGLSSFAAIAARREHPALAPGDAAFRRAFQTHFTRLLAGLPRTPEMLAVLRRQRERAAALDREGILAEFRQRVADPDQARAACTLAEADEIVRAFHRLHRLLPLREETLAALDAAIEDRSRP